tara:strand:+ start:246 stop:449 length:204 start_codon:yes stop_codon:yes gene_type:complete
MLTDPTLCRTHTDEMNVYLKENETNVEPEEPDELKSEIVEVESVHGIVNKVYIPIEQNRKYWESFVS